MIVTTLGVINICVNSSIKSTTFSNNSECFFFFLLMENFYFYVYAVKTPRIVIGFPSYLIHSPLTSFINNINRSDARSSL